MGTSFLSRVSLSNVVPFVCLVLVVFSETVSCDDKLRDEYFDECVLKDSSNSKEGRRGQAWYNYTQINILSLIPCTDPADTSGVENCTFMNYLPILAMVEDEINERDDILKGYRLKLSNINSGCNRDRASVNYFEDVTETLSGNGSVKHMIMGPACTVATEPVAGLGKYMNMSQVSYTASGPQFAKERDIYSRFFTMQPSITLYNDAYLAIFGRYNWTRIAIIHEVDPLFTEGADDLHKKAENSDPKIVVEHFGNFVDDPTSNLKAIKDKDIRIIVALFNPRNAVAEKIWCTAYEMGLTDAHHVWFTPVWAEVNPGDDSCGEEKIKDALNFSFGTLGSDMRDKKDAVLQSGKTVDNVTETLNCYKDLYNQSDYQNFSASVTLKEGYVYDSVWAIALALNKTIADLEANGSEYKLEDFQYSNVEMANMMLENLQAVNFEGISGDIVFEGNSSSNTNGNRQDHIIEIRQFAGMLDTELMAYYHTRDKNITFVDGVKDFSWRGGFPPPDRPSPKQEVYAPWAVVISCLSSGAGVILSLACLTFTVYYRKHRVFKRATPRLNVMICIGTILGFSSTFLYSMVLHSYQNLPHKEPLDDLTAILIVCNLVNWLTYIGFTLAFGSLLMKTWRLYRIFYNPEIRKRKYLEDRFLILGVMCMLVVVLVILAVWTGVAYTRWCESSFSENNLVEYRYFRCCASDQPGYIWYIFLGIMLIAFAIVLLFGMFMAYQIKKNLGRMLHKYTETPLINISAVMALTFSYIFLILHWLLPISAPGTLSSLLILVALRDGFWMYPMLLILYIPMAYELVQDKRGKRRRFSSRGSIASHVEAFSQRHRRDSSFSNSSYSLDERRPSFSASNVSGVSSNKTSRPLSPLREEITTEVQEESSPNMGRVSFAVSKSIGEDDVFNPNPSDRHHNASPLPLDMSNRRPSILKSGPLIDMKKTDQHVKFSVSK